MDNAGQCRTRRSLYAVGDDSSNDTTKTFKWERPTVYLDQWVWIRLANAMAGQPRETGDIAVLQAVQDASQSGVAFPLSSTHYVETLSVNDPRQRRDLARAMASISYCRTIRSSRDLLRHQFLAAMHETFGKPFFRPKPPTVFGTGVFWTFLGGQAPLRLRNKNDGAVVDISTDADMQKRLRHMMQWAEIEFLAGPKDDQIEQLRRNGYRPEHTAAISESRLAWETTYADLLADDPVDRRELRVRVQARELIHEHLDLFNEVMGEYRINVHRALGIDPSRPGSGRPGMIDFVDRIRSIRVAVDLKTELYRNPQNQWSHNAVRDIDAMGIAVPYCDAVLPDSEVADWLSRAKVRERFDTQVVRRLRDLPELLESFTGYARSVGGDMTGWDWAGPGDGFCLDPPPTSKQAT
jgi:hypothetical protein